MAMRSPIRKSILRRITWMGGDRRVVGFSALLLLCIGMTMFMGFGFFFGLPIIVPIVFFIGILWVAREMNNSDHFMVDVVLRQFRYRKYYAAKPDLGTEHPEVRDFVS
ncbi:VirB3 family type IV secretion system protein [Methylicorpusculum sp.]|uniref:VirB3 family type IV secretion system protein n=1 Tax=Methylicorpusculum sp. TaxID=2713644 RepID=UPI002AB908CB|nr:VirB3 family type IV secretion system protein [Methylicorpusculum sp.]MDZ4153603.1 VirB3 family type IV secretion system protein [Methylicorpusculum sp.]